MLISKEKAERIAELSYKLYELGKKKEFITYKVATELDEKTGNKLIDQLISDVEIAKIEQEARALESKIHISDSEIVVVDNYQYLESVEYDSDESKSNVIVSSLECKFVSGDRVIIPNNQEFYAPHIYGHLFDSEKNKGYYPLFKDPAMKVLYLKMMLAEDRRINPYVISEKGPNNLIFYKYMFPMEEALRETFGYEYEIELLNELLNITHGRFFSQGSIGGFADIAVKPTVLYLESIGEVGLANKLRAYDKEPLLLNLVLDYAKKGYNGISFSGGNTQIRLL